MRNTIWITDLRTVEAREARAFFLGQGDQVIDTPEGFPLWDPEAVSGLIEPFREELTGVIHPAPPPFQRSLEEADEALEARARDEGPMAAWSVTKVCGEIFRRKGRGTLIYLNSVHAEKPMGYGTLFSAGCGAVQMLNREVSQDYGPDGVRCYFIQRGPSTGDPELKNDLSSFYYGTAQRYPTRKMPEKDSLNPLLAFLLTPAAAPLNGSDLRADGGMTMYYGQRADSPRIPPEFAPSPHLSLQPKANRQKEERVALITGSGKGVGAGIARRLCAEEFRCVINCNTNRAMAEETLADLRALGGEAVLCPADVSDPAQARRLVQTAVDQYGRLDVLVNNAAMQYNRFLDQYDPPLIRKIWEINFGGYWRMIRAALPFLRKSPMPRIINIGSVHGKRPTCFDAGYAMSKGAVKMLTREAALELLPEEIPVIALSLGGCKIEFKTGMPSFPSTRPMETINFNLRRRDRLVLPEEVGEAVACLCSEAGAAMTGDCVRIDCGQMLG